MAADTDAEMKTINTTGINVDIYRKLVQNYLNLHLYQAALFWADKTVALSSGNPKDVYWQAQCMFLLRQFHRAAHLLRSRGLDKTYVLCNYLAARCLKEANELTEALKVINSIDIDALLRNSDNDTFNDMPTHQIHSSILLLKGQVLEAMDNRGLAADCFKEALKYDVYCFEAFDALIKHQMLSVEEEEEMIKSLPITECCSEIESKILLTLYDCKRKKYHTPMLPNKLIKPIHLATPNSATPGSISTPVSISTPNFIKSTKMENKKAQEKVEQVVCENNSEDAALAALQNSLDLIVAEAERIYYNCDYQRCAAVTEKVLKEDPYHHECLPIHVACQVELKQSNKLFSLAHNLVDLYPDLAISWFAVGCYYYIIGKSDSARRYLAKATCLDRLFGPAWLAYGHSFAIENEHDQAMAAYFKASQLMKGCHLPLLYIGLECGLTNNVRLAMKFFQQAQAIAPNDPFVMHEMGVIAFQNLDYKPAEKYFRNALEQLRKIKDSSVPKRWEPLLNNLGHTCRKLKKYQEALDYHHQALVLSPQSAGTYSAIGYIHALMGHTEEAVDWFHKALGLRRDDTFSTTMLSYVIEQLSEEQAPYPGAPDHIPNYLQMRSSALQKSLHVSENINQNVSELSDMSMSM